MRIAGQQRQYESMRAQRLKKTISASSKNQKQSWSHCNTRSIRVKNEQPNVSNVATPLYGFDLSFCCRLITGAPRISNILRCSSDISCTLHDRALSQSVRISTFSMRSRWLNRWGSIAHHERPINARQQGRRVDDKGPPHAMHFSIWIQFFGTASPCLGYLTHTLFE